VHDGFKSHREREKTGALLFPWLFSKNSRKQLLIFMFVFFYYLPSSSLLAKLRIKSEKAETPKQLSKIEADGLGVSFFGLYPQLCENGGVCAVPPKVIERKIHHFRKAPS
jgi:hypothetical protein